MTPGGGPFRITVDPSGEWIGVDGHPKMYERQNLDLDQFEAICAEMNCIHEEAYAAGAAAERERLGAALRGILTCEHDIGETTHTACEKCVMAGRAALDAGKEGGDD